MVNGVACSVFSLSTEQWKSSSAAVVQPGPAGKHYIAFRNVIVNTATIGAVSNR